METAFDHTVLIVDNEETSAKAIAIMLKRIGAKFIYARDGETALEKMQKAVKPFSMILCDLPMSGMDGLDFLEKAKEIFPETIRFVITGLVDKVQTIIDAVNRGAIHRYILKPWDNLELMDSISKGLKEYELVLENELLLVQAKEQNMKLYEFNEDLKNKAEAHKRQLAIIDREIKDLEDQLSTRQGTISDESQRANEKIQQLFKDYNLTTREEIESFFDLTLEEFYDQFQNIAARNDFKMPDDLNAG